jgi:ABC-2 type transport system ATP-binding protein
VLRLRDRGCTVFFSSHILSDAEAVCGRVGILAGGRLVACGRLSEVLASELRGWELVVSGMTVDTLAPFAGRVTSTARLAEGRLALEFARTTAPEALIADLASVGARVVSLTPVHPTLEEYFVEQVGRGGESGRDA